MENKVGFLTGVDLSDINDDYIAKISKKIRVDADKYMTELTLRAFKDAGIEDFSNVNMSFVMNGQNYYDGHNFLFGIKRTMSSGRVADDFVDNKVTILTTYRIVKEPLL